MSPKMLSDLKNAYELSRFVFLISLKKEPSDTSLRSDFRVSSNLLSLNVFRLGWVVCYRLESRNVCRVAQKHPRAFPNQT